MTPEYLVVALGSALGGILRYAMTGLIGPLPTLPDLPADILLVNVLGSLVIGVAAGLPTWSLSPNLRQFLMVGLCGGFTTFSVFSVQNMQLLQNGEPITALANIMLSVVLCLLATAVGFVLGDRLGGPP